MATKKTGRDEGVREKILAAAADVFAEEGFAGARVDVIARRAGVNKALLYYHVGNKAELYEAVLLGWMDVLFASLRERVGVKGDPEEKLAAMAMTFEELVRKHHQYPQILVREFTSGGQNLAPPVMAKLLELIAFEGQILEEGRRMGVFRQASPITLHLLLVVGTVMHLMGRRLIDRSARLGLKGAPVLPDSPSRAVLDLLLDGLRTHPGLAPDPKTGTGKTAAKERPKSTSSKEERQ